MKRALIVFKKFLSDQKKGLFISFVLLVLVLLLLIPPTYRSYNSQKENMAISLAQTAQASINRYKIKNLEYNDNDLIKEEYIEVRNSLFRLTYASEEIEASYIMVVYENKILAAIDSQPVYSQDYKPPGTILGGLDDFEVDLDKINSPYVLYDSPFGDDYVVVIAPIADDHTGEVIGLYANLYLQKTWKAYAIAETAHLSSIAIVIFILINAFYFVGNLNYKLYKEKQQLLKANKFIRDAKKKETQNLTQIRKSEKKLSKIFEMVPTMIVLTSNQGEIKEANEAFLKKKI